MMYAKELDLRERRCDRCGTFCLIESRAVYASMCAGCYKLELHKSHATISALKGVITKLRNERGGRGNLDELAEKVGGL